MPNDLSNSDDVIDSRDIIARVEELQALANEPEWTLEHQDELAALEALAKQGADYADDWDYGETLIRDSYFETYAQDLADDIGAINSEAQWPNNCIDWKRAARELQMDYTAIDFDGVTYWIR